MPRTAYLLGFLLWIGSALAGDWPELERDGIHDPENPAVPLLQDPGEALGQLPSDTAGNQVRWVEALRGGYIQPRSSIYPDTEVNFLDQDILMKRTGSAKYVLFPHSVHTEWLDCANCHDKPFARKAGETPMSMLAILSGQYCGRCHGAVAFPLTECDRCHSISPIEAGE